MIWKRIVTLIAAIALISLSACHLQALGPPLEGAVATALAQTQAAQTSLANALAGTLTAMIPATPTLTPTSPFTPTITDTPTPTFTLTLAAPMVSVSMDTNCRTGPGNVYDLIGGLKIGETAAVVGRDAYNQYWIIKNPDNLGTCWIWGKYATVAGDTSKLPVIAAPPTPTPVPAVTNVTVAMGKSVVHVSSCIGTGHVGFQGVTVTITTNGPMTVAYSFEETTQGWQRNHTMTFGAAGTQSEHFGIEVSTCGTHVVKAVVTSPNSITGQASFQVVAP
jgi:uncharacterized protein YgiM (DUF1202 family)